MIRVAAILATLALETSALAVGLGPLRHDGIVDGPRKAFYLTLFNPYDDATDFVAYAVGLEDDEATDRVRVYPSATNLGGHQQRRLLVVARDLSVGEAFSFRVCAQRKTPPVGIDINARVCSKIRARRVL